MRRPTLVVDPGAVLDEVMEAVTNYLTSAEGFKALGKMRDDGATTVFTWRLSSPPIEVKLVNDTEFGGSWIRVETERPVDLVRLRKGLAAIVPFTTLQALRERARHAENWPGALVMLAVVVGRTPDPEDIGLLAAAIRSPDRAVRIAGATGAGLVRAAEFIPLLKQALDIEEDREVRRAFEYAIARCDPEP